MEYVVPTKIKRVEVTITMNNGESIIIPGRILIESNPDIPRTTKTVKLVEAIELREK